MVRSTSPSLRRVLLGGALTSVSLSMAFGCAAAEETTGPLRPVVDAAPVERVPGEAAPVIDGVQPGEAVPAGAEMSPEDPAADAPQRVEFPVPTVPARTAAVGPAEQPAVDAFRVTWAAILGFYGDLDVADVEPVRTLSDDLVEVWVAELTRWRDRGAVSGLHKSDAPSWQRIEAVRRLDADTVELEYCSFVNLELRDASGAVVLDGNSFVSREVAVMKQQEGQWFWSTTYNAAPVAGELVRDCAWR